MMRMSQTAFSALIAGPTTPRRLTQVAGVAGLSVPLSRIRGLPRVGATSGDVIALNAQVDALNTTFSTLPPATTIDQVKFLSDWVAFLTEWEPWEDQHKDDTISGLGALGAANNQAQAEFNVFQDRFNGLLAEYKAAFPTVPTPAKPFTQAPVVANSLWAEIKGALGTTGLLVAGVAVAAVGVAAYSAYESSHRGARKA